MPCRTDQSTWDCPRGAHALHSRIDAMRNDRKRLLAEANRELQDGNVRAAIALYRRVLLEEPRNAAVALRAAPLLARIGGDFEAWQLFRMASQELMRARRREECLAALKEACQHVPHEFEAWRLRSELELKLGREDAAFATLLEGRRAFRQPQGRAQAIALLERARQIEPWDLEVGLDLAQLYAKTAQKHAALELLELLSLRGETQDLRRVAAQRVRITFALGDLWAWIRTHFAKPAPSAPAPELLELELLDPILPAAVEGNRSKPEPTLPLVETVSPDDDPDTWRADERITH
jgi:tetratricopeptide (TPR) repeat protein